jgi:hypothetical protein
LGGSVFLVSGWKRDEWCGVVWMILFFYLRIEGPIGLDEGMDDVRANGCNFIVDFAHGCHDSPATNRCASLGEQTKDVTDGIGVEGLGKSQSKFY